MDSYAYFAVAKTGVKNFAEIERNFNAALEKPIAERRDFLERTCVDKATLDEVLSLLEFEEKAVDFIETPPEDLAANLFSKQPDENLVGMFLNHYRVISKLGSGGMGEVYLAEDTKLGRKIALKLLPFHFSKDEERKLRFVREARAVSALNHPNIITIYGIEEAENLEYIATEFIDGNTLQDRIKEGRFAWQEMLDVAIQIASALESAHSVGIIHRDIKPANIMIRKDGIVKVLDFGLAKLTARNKEALDNTDTRPGSVMGTINYMSPEQALGEPIDIRTDIFSLGAVLYEMLSGEQPFKGLSDGAIYNDTINKTPPILGESNPDVPVEIERIIDRAMEKDRKDRYQTASDLRSDLERLREVSKSQSLNSDLFVRNATIPSTRYLITLGAAAAAIAVSLVAYYLSRSASNKPPFNINSLEISQLTYQIGEEIFPNISPDGKTLIYASRAVGNWDIYAQRVGGKNPLNLTQDSAANDTQPAISPDGRSIAFRSERDGGGIFVMGETGENPRRISDYGFNPSWSPDGKEIVAALEGITHPLTRLLDKSTLWAINVETGEQRRIGDFDAVQPAWSPNGKLIAFWTATASGQRDIQIVDAAGGTFKAITDDAAVDWNPTWSADGKFLYFASDRGGSMNLWRVAINDQTGDVSGDFQPATIPSSLGMHFRFSNNGKQLAYVQNHNRRTIQHIGFDPSTEKVTGQPIGLIEGTQFAFHPAISPDGEQIAFSSNGDVVEDIFVVNKDGSGIRKLTDDKARDRLPRWSPDGKLITFYSNRSGKYEIWSVRPDGSDLRMLTDAPDVSTLRYGVWSPDGKLMAYVFADNGVQIIDVSKDFRSQTPLTLPRIDEKTVFDVWSWSPDGKYLTGVAQNENGGIPGIVSYSIENNTYKRLNERGSNPIWLNDNRRILYNFDDKIFLLDTGTGKSKEIFASLGNYVHQFEISRDNRTIYFGIELLESDIWRGSF